MSTGNPSESEAQGVWWGIWWSQRILTEFSKLNCKREGLDTLLKKICETGSTNQRHESGRPKHMHTKGNMTAVDELVRSTKPGRPDTNTLFNTPDIRYPKRWV